MTHPEDELLIQCARTHLDPINIECATKLLQASIDWNRIRSNATQHGILSLVAHNLTNQFSEYLPPIVLEELNSLYRLNTQRNLLFTGELLMLLEHFDSNGIETMPLKGPVLALQAYENLSLRQFSDLDILVKKDDIPLIARLLKEAGYSSVDDAHSGDDIVYKHHAAFKDQQRDIYVEIHWSLANRYFGRLADPEQLWQNAKPLPLLGHSIFLPAPEDLLLYLCCHGGRHQWQRMIWIVDVAEFLSRTPDLDWPYIIAQARRLGASAMVALGLSLAKDLSENREWSDFAYMVKPKGLNLDKMADDIWSRYFVEEDSSVLAESEYISYQLQVLPKWQDKLRFLSFKAWRRLAPNEADRNVIDMPRSLGFVYFFLRPIRLVYAYGGLLVRYFLRKLK